MDKSKILSCERIIRFQDCDPFNHLNNGRYLDYFMNAREDHLVAYYDIHIYDMARELGISWVVASNKIAYLRPAILMEKVVIESQIIFFSDRDTLVEMRMYNANKTELKALLWSNFVHYHMGDQRVEKHGPALMELFEEVCAPVDQKTFDERHMALLKFNRKAQAS